MLRQIKPRNARSKRALEKREPRAVENPKVTLLLRGNKCSQAIQGALSDLHSLRAPLARKLQKKNIIHPFEDASSLEFLSEKNDAGIVVFGSSTKKRPHTLTLARMFAYHVLDMLELHLDPATHRTLPQFRSAKPPGGLRPMLVFAGPAFESPVPDGYTMARSLLTDMFKGEAGAPASPGTQLDVEGLRFVILVAAGDATATDPTPAIRVRGYAIRTKRSGQRLPRVEVDEMGPRMDLRIGRVRHADEAAMKEAMRRPRGTEEKTKKNVVTDLIGDKIGRIHLGKLDLGELQTRKMRGLKRDRDDDEEVATAAATAAAAEEDVAEEGAGKKRRRA